VVGAERAQDSGTLYNLCLVSRSWRDVAQQTLYHSYHPDYSPPRKRILKSSKNPWKLRLEPFLRTIASRPDLAGSIQTVIIRDLVIYGLDFYESRRAFDECARALGTSPQEIYYKGHHASAPSAIKEAFFLGTPISVLPDAATIASEIAGELLSALVAFLPKLEHLAIEEEYLWGGWQYNISPITLDALGVTSIPVKTIEMERPLYHLLSRCTELDRLFTSGIGEYPKMPTVRYLHLRHDNQFTEGPPDSCIAACSSRLTTLYTTDIIYAELFAVLDTRSLYDTLEILHLDMGHPRQRYPLRSLQMFTKLRELRLPTSLVYNGGIPMPYWYQTSDTEYYQETIVRILPPSLVNLFLITEVNTQGPMEDDLHRLIKVKHRLHPNLESIRTNREIWDNTLIKSLEKVGITLVVQGRRGVIHQVLDL
jgi:hypothetical protein